MVHSRRGALISLMGVAVGLAAALCYLPGTPTVRAGDLTLVAPPPSETPTPETPPCPYPSATPEASETLAPPSETATLEVTSTDTPEPTATETPTPPQADTPTLEPTATETATSAPTPTTTASQTSTATPSLTPIIFLAPPPAPVTATPEFSEPQALPQVSLTLLISQVYGGGGNTGAPYRNDFIELYNVSAGPVEVSGWSVQYASATGSGWAATPLSGVIQPGRFLLIGLAGGTNGLPLPAPDITGTTNLAATAGKIALVNTLTPLSGTCPLTGTVDFVGYGTSANCAETAPTGNLSNTTSAQRAPLSDTDRNNVDFIVAAPLPRNSSLDPIATPTPTLSPTATQPPSLLVLINEVAWAGTGASSSDEWIELHNPGATDVMLGGWTVSDGGDIALPLPAGLSIPAGGYLLLERTDDATVSDIPADVIYTGGLSNDGETLTLRDATGALIDTANADGGAWPAGDASLYASMERVDALTWRTHSGAQNGLDADGNPIQGTPRNLNSPNLPTPTPPPNDFAILLNEFLPAPSEGASEFIELINVGSTAKDISGWKIDDSEGGSAPVTLPSGSVLQPGEIRAFDYSGLNNEGDSVRLLGPSGAVMDEYAYSDDPGDNITYARLPDGGAWGLGVATPGGPNQAYIPVTGGNSQRAGSVSIAEFRTYPTGAWATLTGRVILPAPLFGRRLIYIDDGTAAIAVYLGRGDWPDLSLGQPVTVLGYSRLRSTGRLEIYVRNRSLVTFAPFDGVTIAPRPVTRVEAAIAGQLVTLTGRVVRLESTAFWLDAGEGPMRVFFSSTTGVRRPRIFRGEVWTVTGIVTELSATKTRAAGWQIQPRFVSDATSANASPPVSGTPAPPGPTEPAPTEEPTATPGP